ncbi:hypothetical protein DVH05_000230 [Phytophthora capsici]|nr:hypothetical protein DVH05_025241 [Phytophthora capsici]KAG1712486.1 hypothetical protein DVH05_000230 [Phytophthora capsici]
MLKWVEVIRLLLSFKTEVHDFDLALNFDNDFQLYDAKIKEFVTLVKRKYMRCVTKTAWFAS